MTERTHYVYRAYDEAGLLLYIGCSCRPQQRWREHQQMSAPWVAYAKRFKLAGPYAEDDAFAIESAAIKAELPYFNARTEHRRAQRINIAEQDRLRNELRETRPDLFNVHWESPEFQERLRLHKEIREQAAVTHPPLDVQWRHGQYLEARQAVAA